MSARAIQFVQNANGDIMVKDRWPPFTTISHELCYQPVKIFDSGSADYIFDMDGDHISIQAKNGSAKYKINSFASDGTYVCQYVDGTYEPVPNA